MAFQLSSTAFCFPQQLSPFFNGFPIFLNGFPLSKKSEKIHLRRQVSERLLIELRISRHSLPKLCNSHYNVYISPNSVLVFHCHHQWICWRRFLPKSTLYGWLWGYGIWCYTSDSRCGAKFIYNKDQHANTCVSVWGRFPVGKIWSSYSTIKSRFDKP